ncbi:MAG: heavy metal transport/detoxification protein [uncultured bacterium (gcode 4)]|uniref:Heavy metal transport/detoxification protein n=1 Tax=uncultured bacterium (gcode 4) TaxID=1234023 RepID=K1YJR0_9BACT|nr:MAG: heavy metal transport/detoxification protein [uncultured bacterium (gcode 4)]
MNKIKKTIYIKGMHCISCEMLIKQSSETIDGVKVEYISASAGMMDIEMTNEKALIQIEKAISEAGYTILDGKPEQNKKDINRQHLFTSAVIVGIFAFIFYKLDVVQYLPSVGDNLSLWVALLMGIIASVSTCLAIVGSIVIWFSEYGDTQTGTKNHLKTQLSFHAWRIGWFFLLWWVLGLIGKAVAISLTTTTILTIFVGVVVLWMGLHLLKLLPNISSTGLHLPKSWSEKTLTTKNPIFAPLIGALTFFLPCGFTLSMQLIAIKTGNFWLWGMAMALFALWTAPVLLAVGLGSSYIKDKKFKLLHTIIGTLIVFFGIFMIMNGRRMLWWLSAFTNTNQTTSFTGEYQQVNIWFDGLALVPEITTLTAGGNYELIVTPSENGKWCMVNQTIPSLDRTVNPIIKWQPIIYRFTNSKAGTYDVVCWTMGMYQWKIIVQ